MKTVWNKKPKKKRGKSSVEKRLDDVCSRIVRSIGKCERCGSKNKQLHSHHIVGRVNRVTRWDLRNLICLCAGCHTFNTDSAHTDAESFKDFLLSYRPDDWYYIQEAKKGIKPTRKDKEALYKELKKKLPPKEPI